MKYLTLFNFKLSRIEFASYHLLMRRKLLKILFSNPVVSSLFGKRCKSQSKSFLMSIFSTNLNNNPKVVKQDTNKTRPLYFNVKK